MRKFFTRTLVLTLPFLTTGCMVTKRKIPQAKPPAVVLNAKADDLIDKINHQYDTMKSLNATVQIQWSSINTIKGEQKDVTPFSAYILMRQPAMLRLIGFVPVIRTKAFDLASDGNRFKLVVPPKNLAYEGPTTLSKPSKNQMENLRPSVFLDSMLIHRVDADELYTVTAMSITAVDEKRKTLLEIPEYELSLFQRHPEGNELKKLRVIRFHREDLLPYEQDIYDEKGNLVTQVAYSEYQLFGTTSFPGTIVITRPLESGRITLTIQKVVSNQALTDDQFELKFPEGVPVKTLE